MRKEGFDIVENPKSPDFDGPPLVEAVLALQFSPLPGLSAFHLGLFWASIRDQWPTSEEASSLGQTWEPRSAEDMWSPAPAGFPWLGPSLVRMRLVNAARDRGLQIENGWFVLNWTKESRPYARYATLREEFFAAFSAFGLFVEQQRLGKITPTLFEVNYFNAIPRGPLWNTPADWCAVVPGLLGSASATWAGPLTSTRGYWLFDLPEQQGRLHVHVEHARGGDGVEVMLMRLIARGPIDSARDGDALRGLDLGHNAVVHSFVSLTSPKAQLHWGKK